jgi:hypothetical protein
MRWMEVGVGVCACGTNDVCKRCCMRTDRTASQPEREGEKQQKKKKKKKKRMQPRMMINS